MSDQSRFGWKANLWVGPRVASVVGISAVLSGCYEPKESFDQFDFRCPRSRDGICTERALSSMEGDCELPDDVDGDGVPDPTEEDLEVMKGTYLGAFAQVRVSEHGEVPEEIPYDCEMNLAAPVEEYPVCM